MATALDLSDENDVVTFFVTAAVKTLKRCRGALDQGGSTDTQDKVDAREAVATPRGKLHRQILLVGAQDVDRVMGAGAERGHGACRAGQAPQDQRWRQRHGIEGVGGQADIGTLRGTCRYDGDTRGKHAQRVTKFGGGKTGRVGLEYADCRGHRDNLPHIPRVWPGGVENLSHKRGALQSGHAPQKCVPDLVCYE
mgnify:CR=1 FL=1